MDISEVDFMYKTPKEGFIGFASLRYGDIKLNNIAVYTKKDGTGYRIIYPAKALPSGRIPHHKPITKEAGEKIAEAVLAKVEEVMSNVVPE